MENLEPVTNPKLKQIMNKLMNTKRDDANYNKIKNEMYNEIMYNAKLLAIFRLSKDDINGTISPGTKIAFSLLKILNTNDCVLPVFTDWEELYKWKEQAQNDDLKALVLYFDDCVNIVKDGKEIGISINPFSENIFIDENKLIELKKEKDKK